MNIQHAGRSAFGFCLSSFVDYTTTGRAVHLVPSGKIIPHERYDYRYMIAIAVDLISSGIISMPIVVDSATGVLLDGHHRFAALSKHLSAPFVPSVAVHYLSDDGVGVSNWRRSEVVTKQDVIKAALTQNLMPTKTSKHTFRQNIGECKFCIKFLYTFKTKPQAKTTIFTPQIQPTGHQDA